MAMFNDQMTTANAQMRIGSPTNALYNRSSASSSSANPAATPGLLRGPHDPSAPSSSLSSSNSSSNLMSHFGSSAIRFRSSTESSSATAGPAASATTNFKDERLVNASHDGWIRAGLGFLCSHTHTGRYPKWDCLKGGICPSCAMWTCPVPFFRKEEAAQY